MCKITQGIKVKKSNSASSCDGFIWQCAKARTATVAVLAMVSFGDVNQNRIGSICVPSPKETKENTATDAVLAMVSFGDVNQNRSGSIFVASPKELKYEQ